MIGHILAFKYCCTRLLIFLSLSFEIYILLVWSYVFLQPKTLKGINIWQLNMKRLLFFQILIHDACNNGNSQWLTFWVIISWTFFFILNFNEQSCAIHNSYALGTFFENIYYGVGQVDLPYRMHEGHLLLSSLCTYIPLITFLTVLHAWCRLFLLGKFLMICRDVEMPE